MPATATIIRQYSLVSLDVRLIWRSSLSYNTALNFTAEGFTQGQQGTFYLCSVTGSTARRLIVNRSGRLRLERAPVYAACSF